MRNMNRNKERLIQFDIESEELGSLNGRFIGELLQLSAKYSFMAYPKVEQA
ncbi:MAG: hypothetical protein Edafosvirus10_25 [Edafosvirus sp.]|uniref:Uncharacterized protein n=1 Tax=Edafosvirus sp. TaxID=2487765 RepID=A0A3G4ZTX7_9VIRU|nr:MAG: hypothetical protein Edafosvirus10_25 [Edafosvirus sp.]